MKQQQDTHEKFVSSKEGAALLGVDRQSFFYYADSRNVTKREKTDGGKDRYEYKYSDLVNVRDEIQERLQEKRNKKNAPKAKENVLIDWSGALDAASGLRLSQQLYGPDVDIAELAIYQSWRKNNGQLTLCAFSLDRRECFAELQVLPLEESLIIDILSGKRKESSIRPDEIKSYDAPGPYHLIVTNAVTLPERPELLLRLLLRYMQFWVEQYPDRYIKRVYTQAVSERGFMLVQHFFMTPRFDLSFDAYMIDLAYPSASKTIQQFKQQLEKKAPLPNELQWPPQK